MKRTLFGAHSRLLFRTYLLLVAGLLAVAMLMNFAFDRLRDTLGDSDPMPAATLRLIEERIALTPVEERAAVAASLGATIGFNVQLLDTDDVAFGANDDAVFDTLVDDEGDTYFLYSATSIDALIYLGPVKRESIWLRLAPPIFYLSIFVLVGLWLRPLLADINRMTVASKRFAADYREPLKTAEQTTQLTSLAQNLDDMSSRLSGLIQSQKELIAGLSHEMRTPLARIRFALAVIDNESDDRLRGKLDALANDVQEIDDLIATMLGYARLDHPDLSMNWQDVPLEPWLGQTIAKYRPTDTRIAVVHDPDLDKAAMDPRLMTLALSNLLSNACRHASAQVRVLVRRVDDGFELRVEDDGEGISDEQHERVFKAFTRLDNSRNRETGGYGLGLAVVARIAALHGGVVDVGQSADLGGAMFALRWPAPQQ